MRKLRLDDYDQRLAEWAEIDFSVVLGIDQKTIQYFRETNQTWLHFYPELLHRPWVIFFDESQISHREIREAFSVRPRSVRYFPWVGAGTYATQREKMLSGHVYVANLIKTPWFLKIDCDAIALDRTIWPDPQWFEPMQPRLRVPLEGDLKDKNGKPVRDFVDVGEVEPPVLVGPTWNYLRAKGDGNDIWHWCETLESFGDKHWDTERLHWADYIGDLDHVKGPKMSDRRRFVSWLAFQNTDWVVEMAAKFEEDFGVGRLPIASHDSSLWYCACRSHRAVRGYKPKPHWINRVSMKGVREAVGGLGL